jgi:hypothetical protein
MAPEKPALFFPQVTSDPLPLFQNREGLQNETYNNREEISINFVDNDNTGTLVKRKKRTKVDNLKWNKQQRENFKQFGDPYYQEPYKFYHEVDISTPVTNVPQQQQQPPAPAPAPAIQVPLQQLLPNVPLLQPAANLQLQQPPPVQPGPLLIPLPASPQPPQPLPAIAKPPPRGTQKIPKNVLQTIPEDEEQAEPEPERVKKERPPFPPVLSPEKLQQLAKKLDQAAGGAVQPEVDQGLRDALECLAISPD